MFERKLQKRVIRQQRYLEVFRKCDVGLFADYVHIVVYDVDVAWQPKYDHIMNPAAAASVANRKRTTNRPARN